MSFLSILFCFFLSLIYASPRKKRERKEREGENRERKERERQQRYCSLNPSPPGQFKTKLTNETGARGVKAGPLSSVS